MPRNPPAASTRADFKERKEFVMAYDKKKLAAGVKEMRSVAKRLTTWADDLEKLLTSENSEVSEDAGGSAASAVAASVPDRDPVVGGDSAEAVKPVAPAEAPVAPPTLAEVKNFLTKLCAAGYAPQVKALIASYGAASLSGVPAEALGDLMDAARLLGGEENAG